MKKQNRTLIVMVVAVATAALGSFGVYRAVLQMPAREVEVASVQVVVAAQPLAMGTRLHANHLRVVAWPSRNPWLALSATPRQLVDRGLIDRHRRERADHDDQGGVARGRRWSSAGHPRRHARYLGAGQRGDRRRRIRRAWHRRRRAGHRRTSNGNRTNR